MTKRSPILLLLLALASVAACSERRDRPEPLDCAVWQGEVGEHLTMHCGDCHGGAEPAGGYALTSYHGALGGGSDEVANAIAGDADSLLLRYLEAPPDDTHAAHAALAPAVRDWVVTCELAYFDSLIHPPGMQNPASAEFHGAQLAGSNWDFAACAECHGSDFAGGTADVACTSCHEDGPTDCDTCHGDIPAQGAHPIHLLGGALDKPVPCAECHVVPEAWDDPGHIVDDTAPAEVALGALAARTPDGAVREGPPSYDPATGACSNVYCHGDAFADAEAGNTEPVWTAADQASCGSCHGLGPASHIAADADRCMACHPSVADATGALANLEPHLDGAIDVGRGTGDCGDCHGDGPDGAPPVDLSGGSATSLVTVGAHRAHVDGQHRLRGPIPCGDCHDAPAVLRDPGHIDSPGPAEVFPGGASFAGLAAAKGAVPAWDRAAATCSDVYCHGGGTSRMADDTTPTLLRTPTWTAVGEAQAACGTCHGVPPQDLVHQPTWGLTFCYTCHTQTVDEFGTILITDGTSAHIDGTASF